VAVFEQAVKGNLLFSLIFCPSCTISVIIIIIIIIIITDQLKKGKLVHSQNLILDINSEIQEIEQGKTFKYLGIEESGGIQHQQMKEGLKKKYNRRLRIILKFELNAKNSITAIGALALPVLRNSLSIINWRLEEISKIYWKCIKGIIDRLCKRERRRKRPVTN
jgi:hypothetical protein